MYYVNAKARKLLYSAQFVSYKQFLHSVEWLQRSPSKKKKKRKKKKKPTKFTSSSRSKTDSFWSIYSYRWQTENSQTSPFNEQLKYNNDV